MLFKRYSACFYLVGILSMGDKTSRADVFDRPGAMSMSLNCWECAILLEGGNKPTRPAKFTLTGAIQCV